MDKRLIIPLIVIFLDILWFSFILPSIWFIIDGFGWNSLSAWIIVSLTAIWMFFWGIILWKLSDKYWRKNILLLSILLNIIWYLMFWFANNLIIFWIARFLNWFGWWGWSVLQAYIWDISDEKQKVVNLWYVWAASWLWFLLWPILWFFLIWKDLNYIWYLSSILLIISFICCLIFFKNEKQVSNNLDIKSKNFWNVYYLFIVSFCVTFTIIWLQTVFPFYLKDLFWYWVKDIYKIFGLLWIVALIYQVVFLRFVQKILNEKNMLSFWLASIWVSLLVFVFVSNIYLFYITIIIFSIWYVSTNIAISSNIISSSKENNLWNNMWLNMWIWSIWEIFWSLIWWAFFWVLNTYVFAIFSVFICVSLYLFIRRFNNVVFAECED